MSLISNKLIRFQIIFMVLFSFFALLSIHFTRNYALSIESQLINPIINNIFFWLSPTFAVIQTGNLIISWGGVLSCIVGVLVPKIQKFKSVPQLLVTWCFLFFLNIEFLAISVLSTYTYERIFINNHSYSTFSITEHSICMFIGAFIFLLFWSLIGYGLKLTFSLKTIAIIVGVLVQIAEYTFIILYMPSLEKYLPFALSRFLVTNQFRFWENGNWASIPGITSFASNSMILDNNYNIVTINLWWVPAFLLWYLSLVYALPIVRIISRSSE